MIRCICVEKIRDKSGRIVEYILQDENSNCINIKASELKKNIGVKLNVENLTLTTDGRIIDSVKKFGLNKLTIKELRAKQTDEVKYYQQIMDTLGVDIIAMFPSEINEDEENLSNNSIKKSSLFWHALLKEHKELLETLPQYKELLSSTTFGNRCSNGGKSLDSNDFKSLDKVLCDLIMNDPEKLAGIMLSKTYLGNMEITDFNYRSKSSSGKPSKLNCSFKMRQYVAVLHKDGDIKAVSFAHIVHKATDFSPSQTTVIACKSNGEKVGLFAYNIGTIRSQRDCYNVANILVNSDFKYWCNSELAENVTYNILKKSSDKIDETVKKELRTKLVAVKSVCVIGQLLTCAAIGVAGIKLVDFIPSGIQMLKSGVESVANEIGLGTGDVIMIGVASAFAVPLVTMGEFARGFDL